MKKPITVTVTREHGNSGDVITTITDATGEQRKFACLGDCSPYQALASVRTQLEEVLNEHSDPPDPPAAEPESIDTKIAAAKGDHS